MRIARASGRLAAADPQIDIPRSERLAAGLLLIIALFFRCVYILRYRYDSDEPQHLHTTWGWTQGLLQYRDFFDNHTPLFHILFSPLVAALGERTDILTYMRVAMVPLWIVSLWCIWRLGSRLYSKRAGLWAAVFLSLLTVWFFCSVEYRTDNLWTPLWLGTLTILLTEELTKARSISGGLLLGLCFCASMKTSALLLAAVVAAAFALGICGGAWETARVRYWVGRAALVILGALIAPSALCIFFAAQGAWSPFYYGVIQHNLVAGVDASNHPFSLRLTLPLMLPFLLVAASKISRISPDYSTALRRAFLFLTAGIYFGALYSIWTLLTRQDFLPFYPMILVCATPYILQGVDRAASYFKAHVSPSVFRTGALSAIAILEIVFIVVGRSPLEDKTIREGEILAEVLRLTRHGEYVMDFKGESVFRRRAFRFVLEPLTFVRIKRGSIEDDVAKKLLDKHVCAVLNQDRWYPKRAAAFMAENYLPVGRYRVPGRVIAAQPKAAGDEIKFEVAIPERYLIWTDEQNAHGDLDGKPYEGAVELGAGSHTFKPGEAHARIAIFWARASEAGFKPLLDNLEWQYFR